MKKLLIVIIILSSFELDAQEFIYEVFNTEINSEYAEFGVTYLKDHSVIYTSSKKTDEDLKFGKTRRQKNKQLYLDFYKGDISENGDIVNEMKFLRTTENRIYESDISFSPDYKKIYFTWNNFYNTQKRKDSAEWKTLRLVSADIDSNFELSNIKQLPFNSSKYSVRNPEVSKNGKQLFFASDMPGGFGYFDIYQVEIKEDGTYGNPQNLGKNINTGKDELFPFIDTKSTLYFSSYGHKGRGSFDIFQSDIKNSVYQKAENLPSPINSRFDDFAFVIKNENNRGYFTSNRKSSKGDVDIYAFKKEIEKLTIDLIIEFIDATTKLPLLDVDFKLISELDDSKLNPSAQNLYVLNKNETYILSASKENYEYLETAIKTAKKSIKKLISLIPKKIENPLYEIVRNQKMLKVAPFQFDLDSDEINEEIADELNKVAIILKKNPNLKLNIKSHTDSRAPDDYNLDLSNRRANSIVNFIISKGIDPRRITGKGFGETELLNHCKNGVNCSNLKHTENKRIEFIVIEE